jgi:hypothetical protein
LRCATPFALNLFHVRLIPSYPLFKKINCRAADDSLCIATSMDTNIGCVPSRFSSGLSRVHSDWYFCILHATVDSERTGCRHHVPLRGGSQRESLRLAHLLTWNCCGIKRSLDLVRCEDNINDLYIDTYHEANCTYSVEAMG